MLADLYGALNRLEYCSLLHHFLVKQRKSWLGFRSVQNLRRNVLTDRRPMFEPVARTSAHEPNVLHIWMAVNQEIAIPCVFVLAHARLDNGRAAQGWKSLLDKSPRLCRALRARQTRLRVRINALSVLVHGDFQPAAP